MSDVPALWNDDFAPITWFIGFLRIPFSDAVDGLAAWRRRLHGAVEVSHFSNGLRDNIRRLEPLTSRVRPRELVVSTANPEWTAFFDNGHLGPDQIARTGALCRLLQVQGLAVDSVPHIPAGGQRGERNGALQFQMFGAVPTDFLNYVRAVGLVRDGSRYHFIAAGTPQDFEDLDAYQSRRVTERFTGKMLVDYCAALGLRPWDDGFYPGPTALVESPINVPPGALSFSIEEAQRWQPDAPG